MYSRIDEDGRTVEISSAAALFLTYPPPNEDAKMYLELYLPRDIDHTFSFKPIAEFPDADLHIYGGYVELITSGGSGAMTYGRPHRNRRVFYHDVSMNLCDEFSLKPHIRENATVISYSLIAECLNKNLNKAHKTPIKWEIEKYAPEEVLKRLQRARCPTCYEVLKRNTPCKLDTLREPIELLKELLYFQHPFIMPPESD